ncbi:unnamed protein product, partial [Didymodactylos carnosus]
IPRELLYRCNFYGQSHLIKFPKNANDFNVILFNAQQIPICSLGPNDFMHAPSCASDIVIDKVDESNINIQYEKVHFSVWIQKTLSTEVYYTFTLFATLKHINTGSGMCVSGCKSKTRVQSQLSITPSISDTEIVASAMAQSFAEQAANNIVVDVLSRNGDVSLINEIGLLVKNTSAIVQHASSVASKEVEKMVAVSTWPCKPDVSVCIMPSKYRRHRIGK